MYECLYPLMVSSPAGKTWTNCKRCVPCRLRRQNELTTRLFLEMWNQEYVTGPQSSLFTTFTYSDDCLPESPQAMQRDLQRFWERLGYATGQKPRYFCIGELGPNTNRLHAHAIIFGQKLTPNSPQWYNSKKKNVHYVDTRLNEIWKNGRVLACPTTRESMRYVSRYGLKDTVRGQHLFTQYCRKPPVGTNGAKRLRNLLLSKSSGELGSLEESEALLPITHLITRNSKGKKIPMFLDRYMKSIINEGTVSQSSLSTTLRYQVMMEHEHLEIKKREESRLKSEFAIKMVEANGSF